MVDQEFRREEKSPCVDFSCAPPKISNMVRQYSIDEAFRDYVKKLENDFDFDVHQARHNNKNTYKKRKPDSEQIQKALFEFSAELLNSRLSENESLSVKREIEKLESDYKFVMEKFLFKMEKFLYSCEKLRKNMQKTIKKFHSVSRITAEVTLVSSAVEVSLMVGYALQKAFNYTWSAKLLSLESLVGTVSIGAALFALSYMRWSSAGICKEVRDESNFLSDLIKLHRRGDWVDEEVIKLFPHGINSKLLDESGLNNKISSQTKTSWRHNLCYAILLTNTQKDMKLLKNDKFITKVKMFVRSQAAEMWWSRRQIKKLLDNIQKKVEKTSIKEITADHDIHFKRIALYLYPVMIPLLLNSWNAGRMKFMCSSLLLIMTSYDLSSNEVEESEELKKIINDFKKDFKEIKEICTTLDSDDDC